MKLTKTLVIFSLLMIFILNVNMASALEFDNVKSYDAVTREVTIKNSFGLGADIGKARLNTPLNVKVGLGYQKVAEFDLYAYQDYNNILKEIDFYNKKDGMKKISRTYDFKFKTQKEISVDDYKEFCDNSKNGTLVCDNIKIGSHKELIESWEKINPADLKKNEFLTIGIFTDVQRGDFVEWIPQIYGVKIDEWATWQEASPIEWNTKANTPGCCISANAVDGQAYEGQWFSIGYSNENKDYNLTGVSLGVQKLSYGGASAILNVRLFETNASGYPLTTWANPIALNNSINVASIPTGSITYYNVTLGTGNIILEKDSFYAVLYSVVTGNNDNEFYFVYNASNPYLGGRAISYTVNSNNFGRWSNSNNDVYFIMWGTTIDTDQSPQITLNSPADNTDYTTSPVSINFNCSAYDDINLTEVKFLIDDVVDQTNASGLNNSVYIFPKTLSEGNYTWTCEAFDNESLSTKPTARNIRIDATAPNFTINSPITDLVTSSLPYNVTLNVTTTDANLNSCWYFTSDNSTNITFTCNSATNISFTSGGDKIIYIWANDTLGNENNTNASFLLNYITESASYPNPVIEGETYPINLTINATEISSFSGTLYYNGTAYTATSSNNGTVGILNTSLFIDAVTSTVTKTFYWNYTLNGLNYSSSTYNHTIYFINPINVSASCSAGLASAMCFDFKDELNLTALSGDINYNFRFGITNSSLKEAYGSLTGISNFCLCVNATVYNNYTLGEGEIQYSKTGYADRRFYTFSTQRLTNETINNTLYLLPSASTTSFLFDFKDTSLAPYISRYTTLLRWYPNLNEYKIVEMAKTDDKGETIMRVQTEDIDYRVGLYETNGSLITLLNPVRFACISAPCSYSSLVDSAERDYTSFFDVEGSIEFNETTNIWTLTWNDPSQNTDSMNLIVTRERGDSSYTICDVSASGFTGILTCDSTGYTGTLVAVAYRTASPATPIFQKIINTLSSPFASSVGLFFSFILVALLMLIGVYSPVASVILGILALLPALYMGVIPLAIFIPIACLGGIIIHFMKRTG